MGLNLLSENYGENLNRYLSDYQSDLKKDIKLLERLLAKSPEGNLRIQKNGKRYKWYRCQFDNKKSYIKKNEMRTAANLAMKHYYEQMLAAKKEELELIATFNNNIKQVSESEKQLLSPGNEISRLASIGLMDVNIKGKALKATIEEWLNESYQTNPNYLDNLKIATVNGLMVRSKSEAFIASELAAAGIPFRYECILRLNDGRVVYPDFMILNPYNMDIVIWEHLGMMDDDEYRSAAFNKIRDYIKSDYIPDRNLILTYETKNAPLDFGLVKKKVKYLFA